MNRYIIICIAAAIVTGFVISYFVFILIPDFKQLSDYIANQEQKTSLSSSLISSLRGFLSYPTTQNILNQEQPSTSPPSENQPTAPSLPPQSPPPQKTYPQKLPSLNQKSPTPQTVQQQLVNSHYLGKIKISSVQAASAWSSSHTLITLTANLREREVINITGWRIEGSRASFTIPQGVEKYYPSYELLPPWQIPLQDIFIRGYNQVYLSSAVSPLGHGNINFKPNNCFGYLTNYYSFPISIYKSCPRPGYGDEKYAQELYYFSTDCQRYILNNLGYCEIIEEEEDLPPNVVIDRECVAYIKKNFNYQGCFERFSTDNDFSNTGWHIYMGKFFDVGVTDIIYLRDRNGLLVDKYVLFR